MKVAIIYAGHYGSTKKAAEMLSTMLTGECTLFDAAAGVPESALKDFKTVIFGANIRMLLLNKHFRKLVKKLKKSLAYKTVYGYIIGADQSKADAYIASFKRHLPQTKHVVFAGGTLNPLPAKGFTKNVIESVSESLKKQGKEQPVLFSDSLAELAKIINSPPIL